MKRETKDESAGSCIQTAEKECDIAMGNSNRSTVSTSQEQLPSPSSSTLPLSSLHSVPEAEVDADRESDEEPL